MYIPDIELDNGAIGRKRELHELVDAMHWAKERSATPGTGSYSSVDGSAKFCATDSIDEYADMLEKGWAAGVTGVEGLDGVSTDHEERLQFVPDVGGAFAVVPAYIAGHPQCMLTQRRLTTDNERGLTLVIDASFNATVGASTVLAYARAVMRLVAWLTAERIQVAIYACIHVDLYGIDVTYTVPIMRAGDVLQPERIAAIAHPSFLRRAWFALLEREAEEYGLPGTVKATKAGYGRSQKPELATLARMIDEAYSVILLPKPGNGNPDRAVRDAITLKLKQKEF